MAQDDDDPPASPEEDDALTEGSAPVRRRRRWRGRRKVLLGLSALLLAALLVAWFARERIADNVISSRLEAMGLPATYEIESIGPGRQVLRHVVIGDPARPDLTIERVEARIVAGWTGLGLGRITLTRPRLFGSYRQGRISFGSLDKVLFTGSKEPFRLPNLDVAVVDGRGLIDSDMGRIGLKVDGKGPLRGGFAGIVAATAPQFAVAGCRAQRASLYGAITVKAEKPRFSGPVRLGDLACPASALGVSQAALRVAATFDPALDGADGQLSLRTGAMAYGANRLAGTRGALRFTFRNDALTARYDIAGSGVASPQVAARTLRLEGVLRSGDGFARLETEGDVDGRDLRVGGDIDALLGRFQQAGAGSLAAPLTAQLRGALLREGQGSHLSGRFIMRRSGSTYNLAVPQAALIGGKSGAALLSLSRVQVTAEGELPPRIAGNFASGGAGIPLIEGRMERPPGGALVMRMAMADYRAGDARLALPRLTLVQLRDGSMGFEGEARLSGALPGGRAENLLVPLQGNWSSAGGLAMWRQCTTLRFDRLALANLTLDRRTLSLCPPNGSAIVRSDGRGTRIAAGTSSLDLSGRLGQTPIRIRSGAIGFAVPGSLAARSLDVALGPPATASRFRIANLEARIGRDIAGRFAGSDIHLAAVPLDLLDASGSWRYAGGRLTLTGGAFRLEDRQVDDRFQPLVAREATLALADNRIVADASLREPGSDREVVVAAIRHDLASGRGSADLAVGGILFDARLQPDTLTRLALGVVANAKGTVRGTGRIDWTPLRVSSTGSFTTDSLDFAAAFGPVTGASGTIVFTDLLGLVTAPDQQLRIASINPGIAVEDGVLTYELEPGLALAVKGATWPFLDGKLTLQPVTMRLGIAEVRRYVLTIERLNAARFVERLELANLSATGSFDGELPLVFDQNGGRIEGGMLRSRPPGGNVSYVGALTYKDLSPMANFAFETLKSLDYREMSVGMDGALEGEIVTRLKFYGVRQGASAKRNILTDRIGKLPIQFNVNLRAPFLQLASSFKSFYDPAYVRDPRSLGLIDNAGRPVLKPAVVPLPPLPAGIQPPESGTAP
jgi:hypothetical protein